MDEFEMKRRIYGYIKEVCHYSQMQVFATSYYQKNYFQMQIDDANSALISLFMDLWKASERGGQKRRYRYQELQYEQEQEMQADEQLPVIEPPAPPTETQAPPEPSTEPQEPLAPSTEPQTPVPETRVFTVEELAEFNGKDGKPAYVAVNDIVYDVSALTRWAGGTHFGMVAGRDLSGPFSICHQGILDRLNKAVIVGTLEKGV